jgi:prepilin-type N-terminal cleavage/methylation domain-containing protein
MRPLRDNLIYKHGFSLAELLVAIGVIGILTVAAFPVFVNVLQTQRARGAARELADLLNQARQLAIATNSDYRVQIDTANNQLSFVRTSDGAVWIGPGTDGNGLRRLENQARLAGVTANPIFYRFGDAWGGTITVQDLTGSSGLGVVVSGKGRIRICPPDCP